MKNKKSVTYSFLTRLFCFFLAVHLLNISFDDNDTNSARFYSKNKPENVIETVMEAVLVHFFNITIPDNKQDSGVTTSAHMDIIFEPYEITLHPFTILLTRPYNSFGEKLLERSCDLNLPPPEIVA